MEEGQDSKERGRREVTWTKSQIVSACRAETYATFNAGCASNSHGGTFFYYEQ